MPKRLKIAVIFSALLMIIGSTIDMFSSTFMFSPAELEQKGFSTLGIYLVVLGYLGPWFFALLGGWLLFEVSKGKNWARFILLFLFLANTPVSLFFLTRDPISTGWLDLLLKVMSLCASGLLIWAVFFTSDKEWFSNPHSSPTPVHTLPLAPKIVGLVMLSVVGSISAVSFIFQMLSLHHGVATSEVAADGITMTNQNSFGPKAMTETDDNLPVGRLSAPQLVAPINGASLDKWPRELNFRWKPIMDVASYSVEVDCFDCCRSGQWCSDLNMQHVIRRGIKEPQLKTGFVGRNRGRWRVWAVDSNGKRSPKSDWWRFDYLK